MSEQPSKPKLTSQDFIMSQLNTSDIPPNLSSLPFIRKLDHLIIQNFKSFKEETFTGPFLKFTSIVGPNGSGKSNVLDALMFCLCGENLKHNFFDIREYINREKAQSYKDMSKKKKICSVAASFTLQTGKTLELKRQLDPDSGETYYINNEVTEKLVYQNFLYKQGINPSIPNYAITQGQIDKLLMKDPYELSKHIENLSGSFVYKKEYDLVKQQISEIKKNIIFIGDKIRGLKNEKKSVKIMDDTKNIETQLQSVVNKIFLGKAFLKELEINQLEQTFEKKRAEEKQKILDLNKKKLKIQEELKARQQLFKQINSTEKKIIQMNGKLKTLNSPDLIIKTKELENNQKDLENQQIDLKDMLEKKERCEKDLPQIHSDEIISEYLKLYSQWQAKNREINMELQKKKNTYYAIENQKQFQQSLLEQEREKDRKKRDEEEKRRQDIESAKLQISQINLIVEKLNNQIRHKQFTLKKNQILLRDLKQEYEKVCNEIGNLSELLTENVETAMDREIVKKLSLIQGFRGIIEQKIRPKQQKYIVAFSILTSSISKYLLCKDQASSKQISSKLKNMNALKTLIILGNVKKPNGNDSIKENVGKAGISAMDIIESEVDLQGLEFFLQDFCRGKFICQNLSTAFEIRNKKVPGLRQIITLDGDVIRNDGTITSCGNTEHVKRTFKLGTNKKSVEAELQKETKLRDELKIKIENLEKQCRPEEQIKRNEEILRLGRKKEDIQAKIQFLSQIKPIQSKSLKTIEKQIASLTEILSKIEKDIKSIEKGISKDQQMAEFMKKHNIKDIDSFRSASNLEVLEKKSKQKNQLLREIDDLNGKIEIQKEKIDNKIARITILRNDLNIATEGKSIKDVQKEIEDYENKLKSLRTKASQLAVYRDNEFELISEVVELETKYKLARQKVRDNIEEIRIELGASINTPRARSDWKPFEDYIGEGTLNDMSRRKIEKAIRDLEAEKKLSEQKLQKLNTMKIMSKKDPKDQKQVVDIRVQIKELNDAITQNTNRRAELEKKLDEVKAQRKNVFMKFFDMLKLNLRQAYEALTQNQNGVSGKAQLYLEDSEIPFDTGIYYTPTPPTKRLIYDLDQLSGGQKSIASLALQYSLAVSSNCPFLILDESDAYLDAKNAAKLLTHLEIASKDKRLQIIMVTHKPSMFGNCDSLVGVCRPKEQFSKVFSYKIK